MGQTRSKAKGACGTTAGYEWHLRHNERPCRSCLPGSVTYSDDEIRALADGLRDRDREQRLWSTYGITLGTFERILTEQGHRCACCLTASPDKDTWHVDHDRADRIRGILCANCNAGIGRLGDDWEGVQRAVVYLQRHDMRGGHPKDLGPPKYRATEPKISVLMQRCFDMFSRGMPREKVIILTRLTPDTINEVYASWQSRP